jgi:hypothetical protein
LPKEDIDDQLPKGWEWSIYLQCRERLFVLCAKTEEDRNMWMAGFRYLLASTITVQSIMQKNNERLEEKMKTLTEKIVEETSKERPPKRPKKEEKKSHNTSHNDSKQTS